MQNNARRALHSSVSNEWHTPPEYIDLVYRVMGTIDLDPASCPEANENVDAAKIYTKEDDGLKHVDDWQGAVFLNPPYGRTEGQSNQDVWSGALLRQYKKGKVEQAIMLLNAVPDRKWFQRLWQFPICFVDHRIRFLDIEGTPMNAPTHPSAFIYLPNRYDSKLAKIRFFTEFSAIGHVVFSHLHIVAGENDD